MLPKIDEIKAAITELREEANQGMDECEDALNRFDKAIRTAVEALDDVKTLSKCNTSRIRAIAALATVSETLGIETDADITTQECVEKYDGLMKRLAEGPETNSAPSPVPDGWKDDGPSPDRRTAEEARR